MSYGTLKPRFVASALALSVVSAGCDAGPTRPTATPRVEVTYTVSGGVTEMTDAGPVPVEGVFVQEASTQRWAMTDPNGFYSISGIQATNTSVSAIKAGYVTVATPLTATADTRLDILVARVARIGTYTLSGMAYELTPAGRVPIEGVVLYCDGCGSPEGHTFVTTDAGGLYSFSWVLPGITYVQVTGKEGYRYVGPASTGLGVPVSTVGDTRFDVEFVRR